MQSGAFQRVSLPVGYWLAGEHFTEVELRPLTGADEEMLASDQNSLPVEKSTRLLSSCVMRMKGYDSVTEEAIDGLSVGDREALLLNLRALSKGGTLSCTLQCPSPDCGKPMDLELSVGDLLQPANSNSAPYYEAECFDSENKKYRVRFRLPTGEDLRTVTESSFKDLHQAEQHLLRRCIDEVRDENGHLPDWPSDVADEVAEQIRSLDPQAEMLLNLVCPECGEEFSTVFDAGHFIFSELSADLDSLYRQVHVLASIYHWSEHEILSMESSKRQRYLALILDQQGEVGLT